MTPAIALRKTDFDLLPPTRRASAQTFRFESFARRIRRNTNWVIVSGQASRVTAAVIFSAGFVLMILAAFNAAHLRFIETGSIF